MNQSSQKPLNITGYQWEDRGVVTMVSDMDPAQLLAALHHCIDASEAIGLQGLTVESPALGYKHVNGCSYCWRADAFAAHSVLTTELDKPGLQQALCRMLETLEDIDEKVQRLQMIVSAWRTGESLPEFPAD